MAWNEIIYKICPLADWEKAKQAGSYGGSGDDLRDGFIHFSTRSQLEETAARHFAGQRDLVLVAVDAPGLGAALKWEVSRGGDLFPHLHGPLDPSSISWCRPLPLGAGGRHVFPDLAP